MLSDQRVLFINHSVQGGIFLARLLKVSDKGYISLWGKENKTVLNHLAEKLQ